MGEHPKNKRGFLAAQRTRRLAARIEESEAAGRPRWELDALKASMATIGAPLTGDELLRRRAAVEAAGTEFIAENGGGAG